MLSNAWISFILQPTTGRIMRHSVGPSVSITVPGCQAKTNRVTFVLLHLAAHPPPWIIASTLNLKGVLPKVDRDALPQAA